MDVLDAAYRTVHAYPGGAASLGPRMGKSRTALSHEVRPPVGSTAKLGLLDALTIIEFSGDHSIIHAACDRLGGMFIKLDAPVDESTDYGQRMSMVAKEFAQLMSEVAVSTADRKISINELRRIEKAWSDLLVQGQAMLGFFAAQQTIDQAEVPSKHG